MKTITLNFNGELNGRGNGTKMEAKAMKGIYWVCIGNARETENFCRIGECTGTAVRIWFLHYSLIIQKKPQVLNSTYSSKP